MVDTVFRIYETVMGQALPEYADTVAEDLFTPGKPCDMLYEQARSAGQRICDRLGVVKDDPDVEEIFQSMDLVCRHVAFEMFRCGSLTQKNRLSKDHFDF